jgi:MFS family permease
VTIGAVKAAATVSQARSKLGGRAAWYALFLIAMTQAVSMIDRQILAILVPRIKADLQIGDAEMGLLYGTVFALFYAVFSLPLGRLADGWIRTRLLSISIVGWSAMTALAGFANGFALLAVSRLGVGIGEASVQPAGFSIISDVFPKERRGFATSVIAASVALGLGAALTIGGSVADAWGHAFADGEAPFGVKDWQAAFIAASLPGIVLSLLLWRLPEPKRGEADGIPPRSDPRPLRESARTLASILPGFAFLEFASVKARPNDYAANIAGAALIIAAAFALDQWTAGLKEFNPVALKIGPLELTGSALQWAVTAFGAYVVLSWLQSLRLRDPPAFALIAGSPAVVAAIALTALQSVINYGVMAWTPSYLIMEFGRAPAEVGAVFGPLSAIIGIVGPLAAGPFSDALNRKIPAGRIYVTLAALIISPFLAAYTYAAPNLEAFYLRFTFFGLVLTTWLPPIYAAFLDLVLPRIRGAIISFYILTMTIVGLGLGPYAVGLMSDVNGGDLGAAIMNLYWLAPILVALTVVLIWRLPRDERTMHARAQAAGETF